MVWRAKKNGRKEPKKQRSGGPKNRGLESQKTMVVRFNKTMVWRAKKQRFEEQKTVPFSVGKEGLYKPPAPALQ